MNLVQTMNKISGFLNEHKLTRDDIGLSRVESTNLIIQKKAPDHFTKPMELSLAFGCIDQAKQAHRALGTGRGIVYFDRQREYGVHL